MRQPCKECIVSPICQDPCSKLLKYVKSHSKVQPDIPYWLPCNCGVGFHGMFTHNICVDVCHKCNAFFVLREINGNFE